MPCADWHVSPGGGTVACMRLSIARSFAGILAGDGVDAFSVITRQEANGYLDGWDEYLLVTAVTSIPTWRRLGPPTPPGFPTGRDFGPIPPHAVLHNITGQASLPSRPFARPQSRALVILALHRRALLFALCIPHPPIYLARDVSLIQPGESQTV